MGLLCFVVVLFVVRPLVRRIVTPEAPALGHAGPALLAANDGVPIMPTVPGGQPPENIQAIPSPTSKMIDIAQVQGQVHAMSIQKVGELANKNPDETVSIIRQWLHDTPA
jgi:flagellar M-ring protein FliF